MTNYNIEKIKIDDGCIIFEEYEYKEVLSTKCSAEVTKLLAKAGILKRFNYAENFKETYFYLKKPK